MDSAYGVSWRRANGERVAIEQLEQHELEAALHLLEREDVSDPVADALHEAVASEVLRRSARILAPPVRPEDENEERRAA
jgi:hypothetical protein